MPLYVYQCEGCSEQKQRIRKAVDANTPFDCEFCGNGKMVRKPQPPSARAVEVLDNGLMAKRVERPADAERLFKERAKADSERRKENNK